MTVDAFILEKISADSGDVVALISDNILSVAQFTHFQDQWRRAFERAGRSPPELILLQAGLRLERLGGRTAMAPSDIGLSSCYDERRGRFMCPNPSACAEAHGCLG